MIASVSSTAREYRGGFCGLSRSTNGWYSGRARKRQPDATWVSSTPLSCQSSRISSSRPRSVSWEYSLSKSFLNSASGSGSWATRSTVSSTRLTCARSEDGLSISLVGGSVERCKVCAFQLDVDRGVSGLLADLDQAFTRQFEERKQCHDQHRNALSRIEQLTKFDVSLIVQLPQHSTHVFAY